MALLTIGYQILRSPSQSGEATPKVVSEFGALVTAASPPPPAPAPAPVGSSLETIIVETDCRTGSDGIAPNAVLAFRSSATEDAVVAFYDEQLAQAGFGRVAGASS